MLLQKKENPLPESGANARQKKTTTFTGKQVPGQSKVKLQTICGLEWLTCMVSRIHFIASPSAPPDKGGFIFRTIMATFIDKCPQIVHSKSAIMGQFTDSKSRAKQLLLTAGICILSSFHGGRTRHWISFRSHHEFRTDEKLSSADQRITPEPQNDRLLWHSSRRDIKEHDVALPLLRKFHYVFEWGPSLSPLVTYFFCVSAG